MRINKSVLDYYVNKNEYNILIDLYKILKNFE